MLTIDQTLNGIWRTPRPRPLAYRLALYWSLLTIGPVLLGMTLGLQVRVAEQLVEANAVVETIARVLPYWEARIVPELKAGKRVLISAHGNSLRALVKHLSGISDADIASLEIPTGQPLVYELDEALNATDRYYLRDR